MVVKILRVLIFSKISLFIFFLFFFRFLYIFSIPFYSGWGRFFYFSLEEKTLPSFFGVSLDFVRIVFISMVSLVTCLVFLYSEVYIEFYNNKKFFFLTLLFFFFMVILSSGRRVMNSMIGWDGLGVSSLLLIIFYPNKITLFNSFITFFFNRLGDILFLVFFCYFITDYRTFFFFRKGTSFFLCLLFFFCLITKSAQIPFSSWLPAAISAPTPISAMVHSSTLVTAGIFLILKFYRFFYEFNIFSILLVFRIRTFIIGGLFGTIELDLKKIVAFSTIRQIRIILFFLCTKPLLALFHTFGHAFFKTLLFCRCGLIFLWSYRDQILKNLGGKKFFLCVFFFLFLRIYSMRGVAFSSSFYTKDLIIEFFLEEKKFFFFLFLLRGRFLTVIYRSKIFSTLSFTPLFKSFFRFKIRHFFFIFFFSLLIAILLKFLIIRTLGPFNCLVRKIEVFVLNVLIFFFFFSKMNLPVLLFFSNEIMFLKNFSFGVIGRFLSLFPSYFTSNDTFFFKPRVFLIRNLVLKNETFKFWSYIIILVFFIYLLYYSFSLI